MTMLAVVALGLVLAMMLGELRLSNRNDRLLIARGAVEAPDPVYGTMRWAYPTAFVVMALEGAFVPSASDGTILPGVVVFTLGKLIKYWAVATLGTRWTYRVLVLPDVPLIRRGPYRFVRHPNYLGVVGELVGFALITRARLTGPLATMFFSWLLWRRITAENRALSASRFR